MKARRTLRKITEIGFVAAFTIMVLSLGVTYAIGANQMAITGQAYFVAQIGSLGPGVLPIAPIDTTGNGSYFTPNITGQQQLQIISQYYQDGDFYLSICSSNSNNGNTSASISFQMMNPTVYTWSTGTASVTSPWPVAQGGLANNSFSFGNPSVSPTTLSTDQVATVTLPFTAQLGKADTRGSAIVTISYNVPNGVNPPVKSTRIYFIYYPRNSANGCTL